MKRYLITNNLRKAIKENENSFDKISKVLEFNIKNTYFNNTSVREDHFNKLKNFLNLSLDLKEIKFDYVKNLGKYAYTKKIKKIRKGEKLAEFIGVMLGDGNLYKNAITVCFDKRNEDYIRYVHRMFNSLFGIRPKRKSLKKTNSAYLYCYNKNITEELIKLGLKRGNKIKNQIGVPAWIKENKIFSKRCIGGLIDTDGCIYRCKREKQVYIKFTNHNKVLLKDFKELAKRLGYSFAKANKTNTCLYRKDQVASFINDIKPFKSMKGP